MDAWVPYAVREHCRDAVLNWAELEGKSPLMTEHLVETSEKTASEQVGASFLVAAGFRLSAWVLETWWHLTR
jgi:hypothetical protein